MINYDDEKKVILACTGIQSDARMLLILVARAALCHLHWMKLRSRILKRGGRKQLSHNS